MRISQCNSTLFESRAEMIHGQLKSFSSSIWLVRPDRSHLQQRILVAFWTWYDNRANLHQDKTGKHTTEHTVYNTATWQKRTNHPSSTRINLVVLLSRRHLSLSPADCSLLAGGDSYCCCCFRVPRKVCLNGVVSPPICTLRCCPLLPKHRQLEMARCDV